MSEQSDLFSTPPDPPAAEESAAPPAWTVGEFNERVKSMLKGGFGSFRIQGFVSGFSRSYARGGHIYFDLQEREDEEDHEPVAVVRAIIWRGLRRRLESALSTLGGDLDDQQVYFRVTPDFYVKGGSLSLIVEDIDVEASLGARRLDRERLLRQLAAEMLLDKNARLPLPAVPLRLGLITSLESAAYHDFIKELTIRGLSFRVLMRDARMQGAESEAGVVAALEDFGRRVANLDALVLIRGGGSRSDLAAFDSEAIARAIAASPLPVLTGIGHEIDRSVADEVAHRAFKTPTAVAQFLVESVEEFLEAVEDRGGRIRRAAEGLLRDSKAGLGERAHVFRRLADRRLSAAREGLARRRALLPERVHRYLDGKRGEVLRRRARVAPGRIRARLAEQVRRLAERRGHLSRRTLRLLSSAGRSLDRREDRIRILDPRNVLRRGFSITYDEKGRLLRGLAGLSPGDVLKTRLAGGLVESEVRSLSPEDEENA